MPSLFVAPCIKAFDAHVKDGDRSGSQRCTIRMDARKVQRRTLLVSGIGCAVGFAANCEAARANAKLSVVAVPESEQVWVKTISGLQYVDFRKGTAGQEVKAGDRVRFHVVTSTTGARYGFKLASTYQGDALVAKVGDGNFVDGLDEALRGMKVGGVRRAVVPPALGYHRSAKQEPIPREADEYRRFANVFLNSNRAYVPDVIFDLQVLNVY